MASDNILSDIISDSQASRRMAYTTGLQHGADRMNQEWEVRLAEQVAVTGAVRQRIVDLEISVQSLTQELVEALDALDASGGRRVVIRPQLGGGRTPRGDGPLSVPQPYIDVPAAWSEAGDSDDDAIPDGYGEHFDGEPI